MEYIVQIKRKILKNVHKMPVAIQEKFYKLVDDLKDSGPIQNRWPNYGKLEEGKYHCHLSYHWAACWKHEKGSITIEVYYAGSREKAPY